MEVPLARLFGITDVGGSRAVLCCDIDRCFSWRPAFECCVRWEARQLHISDLVQRRMEALDALATLNTTKNVFAIAPFLYSMKRWVMQIFVPSFS